jgi:hypothetical protein
VLYSPRVMDTQVDTWTGDLGHALHAGELGQPMSRNELLPPTRWRRTP